MDFNDFLNILDGEDFEERPVDIEEFVMSEDYLGLYDTPLSEHQYTLIRASSQIYKKSTLVSLYGEEEGERRWQQTYNEVIFQLGKGSGKGHVSSIACAYVVYLLMCLKDPQKYYKRPPKSAIALLNVAINATQANNVFFKYFKDRITTCPWFDGKYEEKKGEFIFDKDIIVYSGHSEREAWEGYNLIYVVLDEISGFAIDSTSGHEGAKTAQAVYDMYRASITSRFAEVGKLVLLSFPRYKNDFIQQRYNKVVTEKNVVIRSATLKLDPDLPDGIEGNEFEVEWEEDHIISYGSPKVFALKRPSWEVNPTKDLQVDYMRDFYDNPVEALSRYACMPPDAIDAFFKDRQKVEKAFSGPNGVDETGRFTATAIPKPDKTYFVHVDLARKHDHCSVSLAHVENWARRKIGTTMTEAAPVIQVDLIRWWTPTKDKNVDFTEVREFIVSLRQRGYNIKLVTFDRWESHEMMEYLRGVGIHSERLSVAKKHYEDLSLVLQEERLSAPSTMVTKNNVYQNLVAEELLALRIMPNDKIDHPRNGSKDLADSVCGAVFNAVAHTPRQHDDFIEVQTLTSFNKTHANVPDPSAPQRPGAIIKPPPRSAPPELQEYISRFTVI